MAKELGLLLIVKDERDNLERFVAPIVKHFDEVVVGDTGSEDGSYEYLKGIGVDVFRIEWRGDFSYARNRVLERMTSRWVLFLDADEELKEEELVKLKRFLRGERKVFFVIMEDGGRRSYQLRAFWRKGVRFEGRVHEQLVYPKDWEVVHTDVLIKHHGYRDQKLLREKLFRNLSLLNGDDPYQLFHRAATLFKLGRLKEALDCYRRFLASKDKGLNPELFAAASVDVYLILKRMGFKEDAVSILEEASRFFPSYPPLLFHLGKGYVELGKADRAKELFERILSMGDVVGYIPFDMDRLKRASRHYLNRLL